MHEGGEQRYPSNGVQVQAISSSPTGHRPLRSYGWLSGKPLVNVFPNNPSRRVPRSFNPIFVLPVYSASDFPEPSAQASAPVARTPGRRTGTGSAAISSPAARAPTARVPIAGFKEVSLFQILRATGRVPEAIQPGYPGFKSLEDIRSNADRPVVVFPECTTSNGRGLLRFATLFKGVAIPVTKFKIFLMCVR